MRFILRSPLHSLLSGRLIVIYTGKKSGMEHTIPVQDAKLDDRLVVAAGFHQHKKWWRNLRRESPVNVCYDGKWTEAFEGDLVAIAPLLSTYLNRSPEGYAAESARIRGVTLDPSGSVVDAKGLRESAKTIVMVIIRMLISKAQTSNASSDAS